MEQSKTNLCIFIGFCFLIYLVNKFLTYNQNNLSYMEGMTTDGSNNVPTSATNGIAGNAASYAAQIKAQAIKIEDQLLIPKYRTDYENVILNFKRNLRNKTFHWRHGKKKAPFFFLFFVSHK